MFRISCSSSLHNGCDEPEILHYENIKYVPLVLTSDTASPATEVFVLASSILAIVIVGLHAFRDGTAVTSDLIRYRHYRSHLEYARSLFDEADRAEETAAVLKAALRVEEAAYFELREFLIGHSKLKLSL